MTLEPRLLVGDCREQLATLQPESVQMACTSPPYFGLRSYSTHPQLWGGDPLCAHAWDDVAVFSESSIRQSRAGLGDQARERWQRSASCTLCGCWRGELGSEPSVEQYLANLVEVFRAVRRVLRPDGVLWCNLGSSYAGSGKGPTGQNDIGDQEQRQGFRAGSKRADGVVAADSPRNRNGMMGVAGFKSKDLIQTPSLLAEALRQDGWWLRSAIPWLKASAMPESVTDRPSVSLEWMFLLAKQATYYWDAEAIRQAQSAGSIERWARGGLRKAGVKIAERDGRTDRGVMRGEQGLLNGGRNRRNGDWFMESLDLLIDGLRDYADELEAVKANKGLLLDPDGEPLGLLVNPQALAAAHFASFPEKLVEPLIRASTPEAGCCSACGAPWRRVMEQTVTGSRHVSPKDENPDRNDGPAIESSRLHSQYFSYSSTTLGWQPSCDHDAPTVPSTVLDPFGGSGTVGLVARRLGRRSIGIDLSESYVEEIARPRVRGERLKAKRPDAPLGPLFDKPTP